VIFEITGRHVAINVLPNRRKSLARSANYIFPPAGSGSPAGSKGVSACNGPQTARAQEQLPFALSGGDRAQAEEAEQMLENGTRLSASPPKVNFRSTPS
jgi:hypothetical protein